MAFPSTRILAALLVAAPLASPAYALDEAEKKEIGAFIREYLIENPEVLIEAQQALEAKRAAQQQQIAKAAITEMSAQIFNAEEDIVLGNPQGDVTVVEFFDYNCGYCRRAIEDMNTILKQDDNVRFVLKEFPILGPDSMAAHRVSMAFRKLAPEKYGEFHRELLGGGHADEETAIQIALKYGVEEAALRQAMQDPAIDQNIADTYAIADALGVNGTPSYVVGDEAVFGAVGSDTLLEKIDNVRSCGSTTC